MQTSYLGKSKVCVSLLRVPRHCVGDRKLLWGKILSGNVLRITQHRQLWSRAQALTLALVYFPVQSVGTRVAPEKAPDLLVLCRCELTLGSALQ